MSVLLFAAIAVVVALAAFVQGAIGVGFALIVAPVLAFTAPALLAICGAKLTEGLGISPAVRSPAPTAWTWARATARSSWNRAAAAVSVSSVQGSVRSSNCLCMNSDCRRWGSSGAAV